jgi:hypothetical protein
VTEPLTEAERSMLEFTKTPWRYKGQQDEAIRREFGITPTKFWQAIRALITRPEALAYDPVTVHRLERVVGRRHSA